MQVKRLFLILPAAVILFVSPSVFADTSLTSTRESPAYQQFKLRPTSDSSKLIYLIDRFGAIKLQIIYNSHYFSAPFAANVARWFLSRNYKNQTPHEWIMQWCNSSVPEGNLIWVKLPNGKFRLSRDVLIEELKNLERTLSEDRIAESQTSKAAVPLEASNLVPNPGNTSHLPSR